MKRLFTFLSLFVLVFQVNAQKVNLKTNTLYLATTTPNIGIEFYLGQQLSFSLVGGYNPFDFSTEYVGQAKGTAHPKMKHWVVMPELKYWFCKSFERGYLGLHGIYGDYNVGGIKQIPKLEKHRYHGIAYGAGISYGYQWALGGRWGLEASVGAGYLRLKYDKYNCGACGDLLGKYERDYWGPTKASISFIYFIK